MAVGPGIDQYRFEYGGVKFNATRLRALEYQAVYNGPDYLFSQVDLHLHGYVNISDPAGPAQRFAGSPALHFQYIEEELRRPRLPLLLALPKGGDEDFVAPEGDKFLLLVKAHEGKGNDKDLSLDCNNGPIPLYARVTQVIGTATVLVDFGVRTWINFAGTPEIGKIKDPPVLLSNRWVTTHLTDQDWFTTISTRGRAVFRADALTKMKARPDDFRPWLLVPIPPNFHRQGVMVQQSMDQTTIEYVTEDRELALVPQNSAVTRMHVRTMINTDTPSEFDVHMATAQSARIGVNFVKDQLARKTNAFFGSGGQTPNTTIGPIPMLPGASPGAMMVEAGATGLDTAELFALRAVGARPLEAMTMAALNRARLPQTTLSILVDVWGYPDSPMESLSSVATSTVVNLIAGVKGLRKKAGKSATLHSDLTNRHVNFHLRLQIDPDVGASLGSTTERVVGLDKTAYDNLAKVNDIGTIYERKGERGGPWEHTKKPGKDGGYPTGRFLYRGTFLERMVAQTLQGPAPFQYVLPDAATAVKKENIQEKKVE